MDDLHALERANARSRAPPVIQNTRWIEFAIAARDHVSRLERARPEHRGEMATVWERFRPSVELEERPTDKGDAILEELRGSIAEMDRTAQFALDQTQREVVDLCFAAASRFIYDGVFFDNEATIQANNRWNRDDMSGLLYVEAPRQFGKTAVIARVALDFLLHVPHFVGAIFATKLDQCVSRPSFVSAETHSPHRKSVHHAQGGQGASGHLLPRRRAHDLEQRGARRQLRRGRRPTP